MRSSTLAILIIASSAAPFTCSAQLTIVNQEPDYTVAIVVDGHPFNISEGIPTNTKTLALTGQLTQQSQQEYPQLDPTLVISKAILNLVRETKRIGFITLPTDKSLAELLKQVKVGDRFILQLEDVSVQFKQGGTQKIDRAKILKISVREQ
jgi:hypothetical protein